MFQQQQQQQQQQIQQQQQQVSLNAEQTFNVANEIKRLQQLHQLGTAGNPSNALLVQGGLQRNAADTSFLQSMLEQQKSQSMSLTQGLGAGGVNQILPSLLQDTRLLMSQNQFNANTPGLLNQGMLGHSEIPLPSPHSLFHRDGSRRMRGGVIEPFPEKLHRLLLEVEVAGRSDVISFVAGGRAFAIHKPDKFFKEIVPLYFRQSRLSSFKRQLNLYGFELINTGPARGGYYHELFVKDHPDMCRRMRRVAVRVSTKSGKGDRHSKDDGETPEHSDDEHGD